MWAVFAVVSTLDFTTNLSLSFYVLVRNRNDNLVRDELRWTKGQLTLLHLLNFMVKHNSKIPAIDPKLPIPTMGFLHVNMSAPSDLGKCVKRVA